MFCKTCEYPLWNIESRLCPECGSAFKPSDFEFVRESVKFCCPFCAQEYYGTDAKGHLAPREFECVKCHGRIDMDQMVLTPASGVAERRTRLPEMPWLNRKRVGFFAGWFRTVWMSLIRPGALMRTVPPEAGKGAATWFALFTVLVYTTLSFGIFLIMLGVGFGARFGNDLASAMLSALGTFAAGAAAFVLIVFLWAALAHLILRLTGPVAHPLGRTYQAMCYASAANVLCAVPCLGLHLSVVSWVWWGVSGTLMVQAGQKVSGLRAAFAVFLPPVLTVATALAVLIAVVIPWISAMPAKFQAAGQASSAQAIASSLKSYAVMHGGALPAHCVELVKTSLLHPQVLYPNLNTQRELIGGLDLHGFFSLMPEGRDAAAKAIVDSMPPDVIAHRVGDVVFTYHGMDVKTGDPGLWIAVMLPWRPQAKLGAVHLDGTFTDLTAAAFDAALREQNDLRGAAGLSPLPDVRQVLSDTPATAGMP